jgi:hypothetical protein
MRPSRQAGHLFLGAAQQGGEFCLPLCSIVPENNARAVQPAGGRCQKGAKCPVLHAK